MKVTLIGYEKMGGEIEKAIPSYGHGIVSIIDISNQDDFESEALKSADVVIKFTNPIMAHSNYMKAFKAGVKLVPGSTGWMAEHDDEVKGLCSKGGKALFWPLNFSLGVVIFSAVNKYLAKITSQSPVYDVTMSEAHRVHKLDVSSRAAIAPAEGILENMERKNVWVKEEMHSANELSIHSIHEGKMFGIHTTRYDSKANSISITHDARNRGGSVLGAVPAAEYAATHEGYLDTSNLLPFLKD